MLDWSLLSGPLPVLSRLAALVAGLWLVGATVLARRRRSAAITELAACLLAAATVTVVLDHLVRHVWMLFPDRLAPTTYLCTCAALFALFVATTRSVAGRRAGGAVALMTAASLVVAGCANQVNVAYGAYPTARDAIGLAHTDDVALVDTRSDARPLPDAPPVAWRSSSPPGLAAHGKVASAVIPAPSAGFSTRKAKIYLPPAYFSDPRPRLPVLVLLAGQPGEPRDWLRAGGLAQTMDRFAAGHDGLAPVVVVADATGSRFGNPLCLDSRRGKADTYLAKDVPAWIKSNLTVEPDPKRWAIAGASYGGTCALQLATNHPDVYPTFLDISGSAEPTLGDSAHTIVEAFGGNRKAFSQVNPLELLATQRYPQSAAAIVVGNEDRDTKRDAHRVYQAATAAGMASQYREVPGAHDWRAFSAAFTLELPWLAERLQLNAPAPS
ncbi:alpha/beta hydrolase [Mycobacterium sp.]|jgi:enterochelin esterase-like enzyme|uniref:alpha/beta hydrolase n=1 Tax=Mycobacterium sp. TaxID=1785 RepID=UPI002D5F2182|nr:alpha/beta hydrolase-fold protein [Mycobacterium sp.]HZA08449.1 alpha/beta hydrolase-fold protein [Mycobacterium sp.]